MKRKEPMPSFYGKNIAQHAQKRFFRRKKLEREKADVRQRPEAAARYPQGARHICKAAEPPTAMQPAGEDKDR